jgi:hypothetical protein
MSVSEILKTVVRQEVKQESGERKAEVIRKTIDPAFSIHDKPTERR